MTDEDKVTETEQEKQEEQAPPAPSVPSVTSEATPSAPAFDADQFVSALSDPRVRAAAVEALRPEWTKDDQSVKDQRIDGLQKGQQVLLDDVDRLKSYITATGGDVDRAVREMQIDDMLQGRSSASPGGTGGGGNESSQAYMEARTAQLLKGAGIGFDDPDYKMLVAQSGGRITNPDQWINVVEGFVGQRLNKKAKSEQIPGAAAASEAGNVVGVEGDEDIESLTNELTKLQALPADASTMAARKEVRLKLTALQDKMGLLSNVQFTSE